MKKLVQILTFTLLLILSGCSSTIKEYYFNIDDFTNGKVYKYECKNDPGKTQYWKLTSNLKEGTLITEAFDNEFNQYEFFKEKITNSGSELLEFTSIIRDDNGNVFEAIQKPIEIDVFKWETATPYKYFVETIDPDFGKVTFEKERSYIGKEDINVLGKSYKVIKLKGKYRTEVIASDQTYEYTQVSYYAEELGLVKMIKEMPNGENETLELTEILSNDTWNKMQ
jgi:hypothetical protein|tara:strand:+ start:78 stop:752 length:675 start_codon:yes stop_codon:yes gene_type:complete